MNKKQMIIAWIVGSLIVICLLLPMFKISKEELYREATPEERKMLIANRDKEKNEFDNRKAGRIDFSDLIPVDKVWTGDYYHRIILRKFKYPNLILSILIIGGLLLYTFRDKENNKG